MGIQHMTFDVFRNSNHGCNDDLCVSIIMLTYGDLVMHDILMNLVNICSVAPFTNMV